MSKRGQTRILYDQFTGDSLGKALYPEPTTQQGRITTQIKRQEACIYTEAKNWRRSKSTGSQADSGMVHGVENTQAGLCSRGVNLTPIFQLGKDKCPVQEEKYVTVGTLRSMSQNPKK